MKIKSSTVYFHSSGRNAENANLMPKAGFGNFVCHLIPFLTNIDLKVAFLGAGMIPDGFLRCKHLFKNFIFVFQRSQYWFSFLETGSRLCCPVTWLGASC
jgi:hypothetical protein